jgi:hypothetical protein
MSITLEVKHLYTEINNISKSLTSPGRLSHRSVVQMTDILDNICQKANDLYLKTTDLFIKTSAEELISRVKKCFIAIEEVDEKRNEEDVGLLEEITHLLEDVEKLELTFLHLSIDEMEAKLEDIELKLSNLYEKKAYNSEFFKGKIEEIKKKINHLKFCLEFPIIQELSRNSSQSTFAHRILNEVKEYEKTNEKKSITLKNFLKYLEKLSLIAETLLYGDKEKALKEIGQLDENTLRMLKQNLWKVGEIKRVSNQDLASAVMQIVESYI